MQFGNVYQVKLNLFYYTLKVCRQETVKDHVIIYVNRTK